MAQSQVDRRIKLQTLLENILGSGNVYFQPAENVRMKYPAIVYNRSDIDSYHANNLVYLNKTKYQVTIIDRDPDSKVVEHMSELPYCAFKQHFVSDSLNHDIFDLYYEE